MKVLAAAVPLLVAIFSFASSRIFVARRQRLRSSIEEDLALWKMLEPGKEKNAFLDMIKGKVRQVVSEESDLAYIDRAAAPALGAVALVGSLFASAALLDPHTGELWVPAVFLLFVAIAGSLIVMGRTLDRLRAAHRGDPEPSPHPGVHPLRWLQHWGLRISGRAR